MADLVANPKPVYIEGVPLQMVKAFDHVDIKFVDGLTVTLGSSDDPTICGRIAKFDGRKLRVTIEVVP